MGKGSRGGKRAGALDSKVKPVELINSKSHSSGSIWKHTILEAKATKNGGISLDYASPQEYSNPNKNTTEAKYSIKYGVWTGQPGDRVTRSNGINWEKVTSVEGNTFDVKEFVKKQGFKWNRENKRWEK